MTTCPTASLTPFRCPTQGELEDQVAMLWPRGRAWPITNDPGLFARFKAWLAALTPTQRAATTRDSYPPGYVQCGTSKAIADVFAFAAQRWCDLREEFWCATANETRDLWLREYGLPDACDPFPDLCTKVAAIGGTRCDYYAMIAARASWSIRCIESRDVCGVFADGFQADCGQAGGPPPFTVLEILVDTSRSPAYAAAIRPPPTADGFFADQLLTCPVDLAPLTCVLDRVVHAHVTIAYQIG